jgi:hypothetical protein
MNLYLLTCEDASHLGGPMGSEYTIKVFSKPFSTLPKAKAHARKYNGEWPSWAKWKKIEKDVWEVDARTHIYTIVKQKVDG